MDARLTFSINLIFLHFACCTHSDTLLALSKYLYTRLVLFILMQLMYICTIHVLSVLCLTLLQDPHHVEFSGNNRQSMMFEDEDYSELSYLCVVRSAENWL